MCRLVAGAARGGEGLRLLARLALLVAEAAAGDPYLEAVSGGAVRRHCHGYGLLLVHRGRGSRAWSIVYERYDALDEGVGEEEACSANLEAARGAAERLQAVLAASEEAYLVFHARRAGRREPRGSLNTHPYPARAPTASGAVELYLAHNGGVDKDALARALGVEPGGFTDSYLLLEWVARRLARGEAGAPQLLAEGYRFARSGYDIALVELRDTGRGPRPRLYIAAGMAAGLDEARRRYYEPVFFRGPGAAGFMSSTVRDLAREKGLQVEAWTPSWGVYMIEPGGEPRLVAGLGGR